MKNYWLNEENLPKIDFVWIRQRWHVEITERERHVWPGKWLISGWYEDEKEDYKKADAEWEKRCAEAWKKKRGNKPLTLQELAEGGFLNVGGEDYFHWNAQTPSWSLHKDGTWNKALIKDFTKGAKMEEYPGVYNSYEEAIATLGKSPNLPPKFEGYNEYLNEVVRNYDYSR